MQLATATATSPASRTPGGSGRSGALAASPARNSTIAIETSRPSPLVPGLGSVPNVETTITAIENSPNARSARGGPAAERRGSSRNGFTRITVGARPPRVMGARVEALSTHGWRCRFDPRADDGCAPLPDAVTHDHELARSGRRGAVRAAARGGRRGARAPQGLWLRAGRGRDRPYRPSRPGGRPC